MNAPTQQFGIPATYLNEYGELEDCTLLGHNTSGTQAFILLDGERGYCSAHLVEEDDL